MIALLLMGRLVPFINGLEDTSQNSGVASEFKLLEFSFLLLLMKSDSLGLSMGLGNQPLPPAANQCLISFHCQGKKALPPSHSSLVLIDLKA